MTLPPYLGTFAGSAGAWDDLTASVQTIVAMAQLCANRLIDPPESLPELGDQARAILVSAQDQGIIEIKGNNSEFESSRRMIAVYVEIDSNTQLMFRGKTPEITIHFLDAFRELCSSGIIIHHLGGEFSLNTAGYELARSIDKNDISEILDQATLVQ